MEHDLFGKPGSTFPDHAQSNPNRNVAVKILALFVVATTVLLAVANARAEDASEPREPNLGDIMAQQQQRHIKLWFAGHGSNWPLADYEIDKLKDGFDDVNQLIGGDTVGKTVGVALAALEKAVEAKDREAFMRSFDELSAGCNSCHRALDHAFIAIARPTTQPFADQSFAPQK
jgi:hypothetical protein